MEVKAILFDTQAIQQYIFSGNKLKTNIGASFIVDRVFEEVLIQKILVPRYGNQMDDKSWNKAGAFAEGLLTECAVGYIGGGKALIFFALTKTDDELRDIVGAFTEELLCCCPGLHTGAAIGTISLEAKGASYKNSFQQLHNSLKQNQNMIFPQVNISYTGLTMDCNGNGEAANALLAGEKVQFCSWETAVKQKNAEKANQNLAESFQKELGNYMFPSEIAKLGQAVTENYFAIVHIDGNNMGKRFAACNTLADYVRLSLAVEQQTKHAFCRLVQEIVDEYDTYHGILDLDVDLDTQKKYLPLRPLILGGDDITFICAGKMALDYTDRLMRYMQTPAAETAEQLPTGIDCCGGIAILSATYPFSRGYVLAEQLCSEAKKESRNRAGSSWLDFALLHGEQAPSLEQIRQQEYQGAWIDQLHFGPYEVGDTIASARALQNLLLVMEKLLQADADGTLAHSKIKELRYALQEEEQDIQRFREQLTHLRQEIPCTAAWKQYAEKLWAKDDITEKRRTPYVDAIEMMEFYVPRRDFHGKNEGK